MNQLQTQTSEYWVRHFTIGDSDIERIYNYLLEVERPQSIDAIARVIVTHRVAEEQNRIRQTLSGRKIYQPREQYEAGDQLVFPALKFAKGAVKGVREGYEPRYGNFGVIAVEMNGKTREFASALAGEHALNRVDEAPFDPVAEVDVEELLRKYRPSVTQALEQTLKGRAEFVRLGGQWFVKGLMADANIGHLHLAEAVLEVNEGGPLTAEEIAVHLDMDPGLDPEVRHFSLNHALAQDDRFDEVGPPGKIAWFLKRLEPDAVRTVPERLRYKPLPYDPTALSPQLLLLERELDDEWSELEPPSVAQPTILSLSYPHRWAGTLPLSSRVRPLFPTGTSARQRVLLVDEQSEEEMVAWVVQEARYIYGLGEWYKKNSIPIGGFITLKPGLEAGKVLIDFDRRPRAQREWVRLANVVENQLTFELERRNIGCGFDELLLVGTDYIAALDSFARRIDANNWSLATLLVHVFGGLAKLNPQETVHTKTLYSAVNMVWRVPPGPLFAELVKHPNLQPVGDHYWQLERGRSG